MSPWPKDELQQIAATDNLHIAPFRGDGKTYVTPIWIWSVVVDGNLYVRAYNGHSSRWYNATMKQKAGRLIAAGITKRSRLRTGTGRYWRTNRRCLQA